MLLTTAVVLSAVAVGVIGARAGYHVLDEEERVKERERRRRARDSRGGRLVANERGVRWTMSRSSLGESLLGDAAAPSRRFAPRAVAGGGGFGTVVEASHRLSGALCALKVVAKAPLRRRKLERAFAELVEDERTREGRLLKRWCDMAMDERRGGGAWRESEDTCRSGRSGSRCPS